MTFTPDGAFQADTAASETEFKSGFMTLVGRPNSGKSTLVNAIVGQKIAITADVAQTTRHRLRAIVNDPLYQLILVDTPGIHKPHDALGEELNTSALKALESVDAVAFLLDATKPFGRGDQWILSHLENLKSPCLLVLAKTDLASQQQLDDQAARATEAFDFHTVLAVSALTGQGLDEFLGTAVALLPTGPRWFDENATTDQDISVLVAEFIREKVLHLMTEEIPHAVGVMVTDLTYNKKRDLTSIEAVIYVDRESLKGMLIGKAGERIKTIGSLARVDLERLFDGHVYLDLKVKLRRNWRRDANQIRRFGYG